VVTASAPGYKGGETSFQVAEAGLAEAKLTLERIPGAAPDAAAPASGTEKDKGPVGTAKKDHTLAYVAFGVGGAGLVFGGVTGLMALGKHGDLEGRCPGGKCPTDASDDVDSYKTVGTLSTVGFIVGAVGVAAGAVLWFTAPTQESAAAPSKTHTAASGVS